jgi:tetratricopeptide (TPR) repeat protein
MATFDVFISYSRRDDVNGRVAEFVSRVERDFQDFAGRPLRPFFDRKAIEGMDDWRNRILRGLRESHLFISFLSPSYLRSEYCEWEVQEYLKHEIRQGVVSEGIAPIYFVPVEGWTTKEFESASAEWVLELRRRQHFDFQPWYNEGETALRERHVLERMGELRDKIGHRIRHGEVVANTRGNIERFNLRFSGRHREMRRLREATSLHQVGVLTAIDGLGGIGKTALVSAYAHTYASEYPGGRWQLRCEGQSDLFTVIGSLAGEPGFNVTLTDEEKSDPWRQFKRVLHELELHAKAATPQRVLLILDNIDDPALLSPAKIQHLPSADWLHVIATTRLGQDKVDDDPDLRFVTLHELPEDEAMDLLEKWLPEGSFSEPSEREAARGVARLLGGFTLAIEAAAIHLSRNRGRLTCANFKAFLENEGLAGLESVVGDAVGRVRHDEIRLSVTLRPTLDTLTPAERHVLGHAALLAPDHVPLPWLRTVATEAHPELGQDAKSGHPDPWLNLVHRLMSLRLFQHSTHGEVVRMHRLVQELVRQREGEELNDARELRLYHHVYERGAALHQKLDPEARWEIDPIAALTRLWLAHRRREYEGGTLAALSVVPAHRLARYADAEWFARRALQVRERWHEPGHRLVADSLNNLAMMLFEFGRYSEALPHSRRALEIAEKLPGPDDTLVATFLSNLALILSKTPGRAEAEPLYRRASSILKEKFGPGHVGLAYSYNNLADLLVALDRPAEAKPLYCRAVHLRKKILGADHPLVAYSVHALAEWLRGRGRFASAEKLHRRALGIREKCYPPLHPLVAESCHNLAGLLHGAGRLAEAEPLYRRALEAREKTLGATHLFVAYTLEGLASLLDATNRAEQATGLHARAQSIQREHAAEAAT